jgi:hypothetical protein
MGRIFRRLKQLHLKPFDRGDNTSGSERPIDNTDAGAGMINPNPMAPGPAQFPPNYVSNDYDDDRPRH